MDCFLDFCLACDKQTVDGLYCSQACRLADLEKAGTSTPTSPSAQSSCPFDQEHPSSFRMEKASGTASSFHPPSAFNFSLPRTSTSKSTSYGNAQDASAIPSSSHQSALSEKSTPERVLSPSSSRTSLASAMSSSSSQINQALSEQAQHDLRDYVSSFDAIREIKRRSLSGNTANAGY